MWTGSRNQTSSARPFATPPPRWNFPNEYTPQKFITDSKRSIKNAPSPHKSDLFHAIHKVPIGDSPYVKAKQVQLIERDPSRSISLFWAAINQRDRVDSALKDMAVVMKQLDRSDEAVEAIKSFRHLCSPESHESLDNVLVELYKRSGRLDEQIKLLEYKLKCIDDGIAFGGKRTKTARSQGRKIQITIEQEKSRLLGNLAWAHLQMNNFGTAERLYRNALSLEADKNKECNIAICWMHMNKLSEAKSLLESLKASTGDKVMEESYVKSFDRACSELSKLENGVDGIATPSIEKLGFLPIEGLEFPGRGVNRKLTFEQPNNASRNDEIRPDEGYLLSESSKIKSWADMVEEDERLGLCDGESNQSAFQRLSFFSNDENRNYNIIRKTRADFKEDEEVLKFDEMECPSAMDSNRRNRLQVFKEITLLPEIPRA